MIAKSYTKSAVSYVKFVCDFRIQLWKQIALSIESINDFIKFFIHQELRERCFFLSFLFGSFSIEKGAKGTKKKFGKNKN